MANEEPTILLTGYAPAPKGTVMQEKQRLFGVVLEVEMRNGRIVGADVPGVTDLSKDFFRRIAVGYELSNGVEKLCEKVRARYWTSSTDSLIACLKIIGQRYEEGLKRLACGDPRTESLREPQTTTRVRVRPGTSGRPPAGGLG